MKVKWHGKQSESRKMPGSGAMGSCLGNWEFDSQTNHNADCISEEDRFKFVDDLSFLETVNLVNIGISSYNTRQQVPNDLPTQGQIVNNTKLKSQQYLDNINLWSDNQEMIVSEKKTKAMKTFCLSILEQSCVVWGGMITAENRKDLERTQKNFTKLALQENYTKY